MKKSTLFMNTYMIFFGSLLCTFLWGSAYPFVKLGYEAFGLFQNDIPSKLIFAGLRFFLAGMLTLFFYFLLQCKTGFVKQPNIHVSYKKILLPILMISFFQTYIQYICFYTGLSYTSGVKASIINSFSTFLLIYVSFILYKNDSISVRKIVGSVLGIMGILLVNLGFFHESTSFAPFSIKGDGLLLCASASFVIGTLLGKHFSLLIHPLLMTGLYLLFGGIFLMITGIAFHGQLHLLDGTGILILCYLSLVSSVSFSLWTTLLKHNPPSKIAIFNFLTPIFGVILSGILLNEIFLDADTFLALCLVCTGICLVHRS